ncbi:hypothetical protein HK097_008572 [Rhizophlyctis rosea]|uniref:Uncharacterized protein n=1 Tax=Rhizophlyctis rosea TaxID=64517 RepID=A0AAD5SJ09_9FUNG|nr:hypothetical protein HK097_008572 [Rhizophlyctis rosea]
MLTPVAPSNPPPPPPNPALIQQTRFTFSIPEAASHEPSPTPDLSDDDTLSVHFTSITDFRTAISTPSHPLSKIEPLLPDRLIAILMEQPRFPELKSMRRRKKAEEGSSEWEKKELKLEKTLSKLIRQRNKERYWNQILEKALEWLRKEDEKLNRQLEIHKQVTGRPAAAASSVFVKNA